MSTLQEKLAEKKSRAALARLMNSMGATYSVVDDVGKLPVAADFSRKLDREPVLITPHGDYVALIEYITKLLSDSDGCFYLRISGTYLKYVNWIFLECDLKRLLFFLEANLDCCEFQLYSTACDVNLVVFEDEYSYELYLP